MANLNQLIINPALCSIYITSPTAGSPVAVQLFTVDSFDFDDTADTEGIYGIGQADPIGIQSNINKYSIKMTLQLGELNAYLAVCGFSSAIQIRGAQTSVSALTGGFSKSYQYCNCSTDTSSIKVKDKDTKVSIDFLSIGLGQ
jgi:hypothetical protein